MSPQQEPTAQPPRRHRVVIIGSGFGGLNAAKKLKRADVDIKLIARTTHHLFQPLLYQVATGIISEEKSLRRPGSCCVSSAMSRYCWATSPTSTWPGSASSRNCSVTPTKPLRQPDRRRGCWPVLFRQRPFRRIRTRHEVHRRRVGVAWPHIERFRASRTVQRSGTAGQATDIHRCRGWPHRC